MQYRIHLLGGGDRKLAQVFAEITLQQRAGGDPQPEDAGTGGQQRRQCDQYGLTPSPASITAVIGLARNGEWGLHAANVARGLSDRSVNLC